MSRGNKNKRLLVVIVVIVVCLAVAWPAQADWQERDKLTASDGMSGDIFGCSVSVSGDYAIVGAFYDNGYTGSAYIFKRDGTSWIQQDKLTASDADLGDEFGFAVSVSGSYAIVGAAGDNDKGSRSGSAYVFYFNGTNWAQQAKLTASDGDTEDWFGESVSISAEYAIVGAPYADGDELGAGAAYIFKREGTSWMQRAKLTTSDGASADQFGLGDKGGSVSISADYAIVGACGDDDNGENSGSAYIFEKPGSGWVNATETAKLSASDASADDRFGNSVSISGDYAIVAAYQNDDNGANSGSVYIFKRDGTSWAEEEKLTASDGAADDEFGRSVSISGNYAIVGAWFADTNGPESGAAYIFKRDGTSWAEDAKLTASDGATWDTFGCSVSISPDYALVGAAGDENGSGSAYVFERPPEPIDWWPMFHHDLGHTGYSTSTAPDTNNVLWTYTTGYFVSSSPAVADGKVYVGSLDGNVYCLDATTGDFIWSFQTGDWVDSSPAVANGMVYVGSWDYNVYCLPQNDPNGDGVIDDGEVIWSYPTGGYVESSPAVADGKVYVGTTSYPGGSDNKVYCLNASTGAFVWSYQTGGHVESSPAVANGKVYVGSRDHKVYCLPMNDPNGDGIIDSGEVIWSYETWGEVSSSPAVANGKVYIGSESIRSLYCLDAEGNGDGTTDLIWFYEMGHWVRRSSCAVADGKVYVGSWDDKVYCLDAEGNGDETTDLIWSYETGSQVTSSPSVADGKVYVGSWDDKVYCLDAEGNGDGTTDLIWSYKTSPQPVTSSPAVADGKVYVGSWDDNVYAFGPPPDTDGDGIPDGLDNCPDAYNPDQNDSDGTVLEDFVSYWKFDEGSGTITYDAANGNDGTINGAAWTTGKVDGALSFDGVDDYVNVPNDPNLNFGTQIDFTIEAWIKTDSGGNSRYAIVRKGLNPPLYGLTIGFVGPDYADRLVVYVGNLVFESENAGTANDNKWHHVAGVVDRDSYVKIYIDSILDKTYNTVTNDRETSSTSPLCIGATEGLTSYIHGLIDEVAIYNRALAQGEIRQHYQNGLTEHGYTGDGIGDLCECDAANIDGLDPVNFKDFAILANDWLMSSPGLTGDTNRDFSVDTCDLAQVAQHWLETCACIDMDDDGYGSPANPRCLFPELDCDDTDPNINPGAEEICDDFIDNDCDGLTDLTDPDCWPACWYYPTQCHGDADGSGILNANDLFALANAWKTIYGHPDYNPCADFSRDGRVDNVDLAEMPYWWLMVVSPDCPPGEFLLPTCWNCATQCYGDTYCNGFVDESDLEVMVPGWVDPAWDTVYPDPNYNPCVDFNRDGRVDSDDLDIWIWNYQQWPDPNCDPGDTWPPQP